MAAINANPTGTAFDAHAFLARVGAGRTQARYGAEASVFSQGDVADSIFYIRKGKIKLSVVSKQRKVAVVAILGAGDFFGEGCLAGQIRRIANCTTMSPCSLARLGKVAA